MTKTETIADVLVNPTSYDKAWMPYLAIGTGNGVSLLALESEVHRKEADVFVNENSYIAIADFGLDEPTEDIDIYEVGLFNDATVGDMAERWVLDTCVPKEDNLDVIRIETYISIIHGG